MKKLILILLMLTLLAGCGNNMPKETVAPPSETVTEATVEHTEASEPAEEEKACAPDFVMLDSEGVEVHLSDFVGKPVILNFWASWCSPCRTEMPDFEDAYQEYGEQIHFVIVNLTDGNSETMETAKAFLAEEGYTFPVYFDTTGSGAGTYGVSSIPRTYFINAEGELIAYAAQMLSADLLAQGISMIVE